MTPTHRSALATFVLLALPCVAASSGCTVPTDAADETGVDQSALKINPITAIGTGTTNKLAPIGPTGPKQAPPVTLPSYFDTGSQRTASTINLGWYENAVNPHTQVWRQKYDVNENAIGAPTLIKTFNSLPIGSEGFTDSTANTDDHSGPDADRKACYQVVETTGSCTQTSGGPSCLATPQWACAYTRGATPHTVGRVQIRLKIGSAASNGAPKDHVQVRLQSPYLPYALTPEPRDNNTWLDSSQSNFQPNSNITYDLKTTGVSDLSDITMITIATPDSDDLCVNEIELLADDAPAFSKSYGTGCASTVNSNDSLNGTVINVPFGELRSSTIWQNFHPPSISPTSTYASFAGFRGPEMISYLDSVMGDQLRNPANNRGTDAGLIEGDPTTTTWINHHTLQVSQHIVAQDEGWNGDVSANTSFDLVIHGNDGVCGAGMQSCIRVENVNASSSFSGWSSFIPVIGLGIQAVVDNTADGEIQNALTAMGASTLGTPPNGLVFCFVQGQGIETPFASVGFGAGSMTLCFNNVTP